MRQIPQKEFYKIGELCRFTDTQPYVLKFWESEFPQLKPKKGPQGQAVYGKQAIDLILKIKQMLDEDDQTITAVRELLESGEGSGGAASTSRPASKIKRKTSLSKTRTPDSNRTQEAPEDEIAAVEVDYSGVDSVSRARYENAVEEVADLRIELKQAEKSRRKLETALESSESTVRASRARADKAIALIESLIDRLTTP